MKKLSLLLFLFFIVLSFCLFADDNKKKSSLTSDRAFEVGLLHFDINFANSFITVKDILQDVIIIDLDKLAEGFKLNLGVNVTPLFFNYRSKEGWGFGLSTNIEAIGILNLSGNMLNINEAIKDNSDISGAIFSSVTINTFFDVQKYKIKIDPSLFYALAYITSPKNMPSSVVYTLDYSDGTVMSIDYAVLIYTAYSLEDKSFSPNTMPGFDFSLGFEYPVAKEIGLTDKIPFLDFDLGFDLINIPFFPATMMEYKQIKGQIGKDTPIKLINKDDDDGGSLFSSDEKDRGERQVKIYRPFKMLIRADWRPMGGTKFLTITPQIGLCYNTLYYQPLSFEGGLNACLSFGGLFKLKSGFNYTDRMYVNSYGVAVNVKACEIDIGANLRSHKISQVWNGSGFGITFGLKFGW
ncbi:hypothetical protein [Treponema sp. R6D11]